MKLRRRNAVVLSILHKALRTSTMATVNKKAHTDRRTKKAEIKSLKKQFKRCTLLFRVSSSDLEVKECSECNTLESYKMLQTTVSATQDYLGSKIWFFKTKSSTLKTCYYRLIKTSKIILSTLSNIRETFKTWSVYRQIQLKGRILLLL